MADIFVGDISELESKLSLYTNTNNRPSRVIHQSWFNTREDIPTEWKKSRDRWIEYHPGWLYILWSKKMSRDFIEKYEPSFLQVYDSYEYEIQRIDSMRVIILKWIGGVYSDLDIVPNQNIEKYINYNNEVYLVRSMNPSDNYTNAFMVSVKGAPFWNLAIQKMIEKSKNTYIGKWMTVMNTTGPILLTKTVYDYTGTIGQLPQTFNLQGIDKSIVDSRTPVLVNLNGGSWHSIDVKVLNFLFINRISIILLLILILILSIIGYYWYKGKYNDCRLSFKKFSRRME